jgi:hypothetical protein
MVFFIRFILTWIQNLEKIWNNKSRQQILLNLIGQYAVQKYFSIKKFNEIDCVKL